MREATKYLEVAKWLKGQIGRNNLKLGDKLYSENELSKKFGLSRQTIRQAIGLLEHEGLVERRQGSGTYITVQYPAKRVPTRTVGVVSTYLDGYIFPAIINGIDSVLAKNNYTMQLSLTRNQVENESRCLKAMLEKKVDGVIVEPTKSGLPNPNLALYNEFGSLGIPLIFFNAYYPGAPFPHVSVDDRAAGRIAVSCLVQAGHTSIAGMFQSDDLQGHLRYAGYVDALTEAGIEVNSKKILWFTTEDIPYLSEDFNRVERLLSGCTGLVCYNDQVAFTVVEELLKRDVGVPEKISVVGIDDAEPASVSKVPLTTVANPIEQLGRAAAQNILALIEDPSYEATVEFQPKLIRRESVRVIR